MFTNLIFVLILSLVHQITSSTIPTSNPFEAESKNVTNYEKEANEWLNKVLPSECNLHVDNPPDKVTKCIKEVKDWPYDTQEKTECCYKWGIVNCWFEQVRSNCSQYYDQTIKNAETDKAGMKNCERKELNYNMTCEFSNFPVWGIIAAVVGALVVVGIIIIICICCFCASICSCLACCLCN